MSHIHFSNVYGVLLIAVAGLSVVGPWFAALISALKNEKLDSTMKLVWVFVIFALFIFGALLYFAVAPKRLNRIERGMAELHLRKRQLAKRARKAAEGGIEATKLIV